MNKIVIAHLYPEEMNIYGDRGNVIALVKRLMWRGIDVEVKRVGIGVKFDFNKADIVFGGGGQDRGQSVIAQDLQTKSVSLKRAANNGVAMLLICGMYQLFGRHFITDDEQKIPGIGIFDAETKASNVRMIGNIVVSSPFGVLVGFENHSGQTTLGNAQRPLGSVIDGSGNNSRDKYEGAVYKNTFGSYLHGPLLPKNPKFADELIKRALKRKYGHSKKLKKLDDSLELTSAAVARKRSR